MAGLPVQARRRGRVRADVAFGGAFYAIVDSEAVGLPIDAAHLPELRRAGMAIKRRDRGERTDRPSARAGLSPASTARSSPGPPHDSGADLRNVDGLRRAQVDRSPCGTGTCRGDGGDRRDGTARTTIGRSFTRASSARVHRPRCGRTDGRRLSGDCCRRSKGRRGSPASTRSWSIDARSAEGRIPAVDVSRPRELQRIRAREPSSSCGSVSPFSAKALGFRVPRQLVAPRHRRHPDLPHRRVGGDDEPGFGRLLEQQVEHAVLQLDSRSLPDRRAASARAAPARAPRRFLTRNSCSVSVMSVFAGFYWTGPSRCRRDSFGARGRSCPASSRARPACGPCRRAASA